jgi:chromosome segregation ATPase
VGSHHPPILNHYAPRSAELAKAYKQLAKEKKAAEEILREVTPLEGLSDLDAFEAHLRSLKARSEMSTDEIRRLAELKTVTDKEVEELKEQVARERRTSKGEIDKLQEQLLIKIEPVQVKDEGVMTQADEDVEGKVHVIPPVEVESTMVQTDAVDQEEKAEEKAPVASPSAIDGPLDTLRTLFTADTPEEEDLAKAYSSLGELLKIKKGMLICSYFHHFFIFLTESPRVPSI